MLLFMFFLSSICFVFTFSDSSASFNSLDCWLQRQRIYFSTQTRRRPGGKEEVPREVVHGEIADEEASSLRCTWWSRLAIAIIITIVIKITTAMAIIIAIVILAATLIEKTCNCSRLAMAGEQRNMTTFQSGMKFI